MSNDSRAPVRYELRVEGHLDQQWSTWFGGPAITHEDDGTTILRGAVTNRFDLHGVLAKVRDLGAVLISVRSTGAVHDVDLQQPHNR